MISAVGSPAPDLEQQNSKAGNGISLYISLDNWISNGNADKKKAQHRIGSTQDDHTLYISQVQMPI